MKGVNFFWFLAVGMSFLGECVFADVSKEELFRASSFISAKISPDGNVIAYVGADEKGIPNVFVKERKGSDWKQATFLKSPEIIQFFWSARSDKVVFLKDEDGTGRLQLHGVDVRSQEHIVYTERFSKVNTKVVQLSPNQNQVVVGLNHRNPHFYDLYVLDLDSGAFSLLLENDRYAKFLVSDDLNLILKMEINDDGSWTVFTADDAVFMRLSAPEAFQTEFLAFNKKKQAVYFLDNRFSDTNQLVEKALSGQEKVLGGQSKSDVEEVLFLAEEPKAYASYYGEKEWHGIDSSIEEDIAFLNQQAGVNFEVVNQSRAGDVWVILNSIPDQGNQFWLYERKLRQLSLLHSSKMSGLSKMYSMVAKARDGRELVCYYTLPKEQDKGGFVDAPLPLVVVPHGGPFKARDRFEFNATHQCWPAAGMLF